MQVSALDSVMLGYALWRYVRGVRGEESLPDSAECLELLGGDLAEEVFSDPCEVCAGGFAQSCAAAVGERGVGAAGVVGGLDPGYESFALEALHEPCEAAGAEND